MRWWYYLGLHVAVDWTTTSDGPGLLGLLLPHSCLGAALHRIRSRGWRFHASGKCRSRWWFRSGSSSLSDTFFIFIFIFFIFFSLGWVATQAMVQGAWGVVPIYLSEISPPAFRAVFVGLTYQLGNAISSPSTQLINYLSENNFVKGPKGKRVEAYGPVMAIATAIIAVGLALTASVGPEKKGARFERAAAATAAPEPQLPVYNKEVDDDVSEKDEDVLAQTQTALSK